MHNFVKLCCKNIQRSSHESNQRKHRKRKKHDNQLYKKPFKDRELKLVIKKKQTTGSWTLENREAQKMQYQK